MLILDLFDPDGIYIPTWEGIGATGHLATAYAYAASNLKHLDLADGTSPPVWTYETQPEQLADLAYMLLSEIELQSREFVTLELRVPEDQILRSSYNLWCDLFFHCLERGEVVDDGTWLDWKQAVQDDGDTVQAILPCLRCDWVVCVSPLPEQARSLFR